MKKNHKLLEKIRTTLDGYPFTGFHLRVLNALGISWIIDGYEVSLLSILTGILKDHFKVDDVHIAFAGKFIIKYRILGSYYLG